MQDTQHISSLSLQQTLNDVAADAFMDGMSDMIASVPGLDEATRQRVLNDAATKDFMEWVNHLLLPQPEAADPVLPIANIKSACKIHKARQQWNKRNRQTMET